MNKSDQINELAAALSAFQGEITNPAFSRTVTVQPRDQSKRAYTFRYTELSALFDHVRSGLSKNGLSLTQLVTVNGNEVEIETVLLHKSGQYISSSFSAPRPAAFQEIGSAVSYMKRYGAFAILGLVGDEDDDANSADGNTITGSAGAKRDPLAKPRWGSGPPPHTTNKAKAEVAFVPAETYEEFHTRAVAAGKRIAATPDGAAYLDGIGKNYGFSMKPDAPNRYDSFELKILNQALCDMEAY